MNKQNEHGSRGIEWTDYTWNPVGGCGHGCEWVMPDGSIASCYAKTVAERVAMTAYPQGFAHHYYREKRLADPARKADPARIFLDSMSDLMEAHNPDAGTGVPDETVTAVFDACRAAHWHAFQLLTKNAPRLRKFDIPANVWVGVSAPRQPTPWREEFPAG